MNSESPARIRLLVVATEMKVGGVATALVGLLRALDYTRFDVDLLLYDHHGALQDELPAGPRLLPEASACSKAELLRKLLSPRYVWHRLEAKRLARAGKPLEDLQVRAKNGARYCRPVDTPYDLAISFIEFWPLYYTVNKVKAKHKLAWIHVDYKNSALNVHRDECAFPAYDRVVTVSEECAQNLRELSPAFAEKVAYLPNIVSEAAIRHRATKDAPALQLPDRGGIKLVTTARIQLVHKGLDRGVRAFARLRAQGLMDGVTWSIIGGGEDEQTLRQVIAETGCEDQIFLLGQQLNPLPLVAQADAFLMTSYYEGKPIAVTEAQILGLPVIATNYASAPEQISDGVDGLLVENSEAGIEQGLRRLVESPELLDTLKVNVRQRHYGNEADIEQYYELFREIGVPVRR